MICSESQSNSWTTSLTGMKELFLKNDQIAKDFFKHAPKIFYTFDTAYATMDTFLELHAKEWGVEDLAELVKNRDENILKTYHKILGV